MDLIPLGPAGDAFKAVVGVAKRMERAYVDIRRRSGLAGKSEAEHFSRWLAEHSVGALLPAYVLSRAGDDQAATYLAATRMSVHQDAPLPAMLTVPVSEFADVFRAASDLPKPKFDLFAGLLMQLSDPLSGSQAAHDAIEHGVWRDFTNHELDTFRAALVFEFLVEPRAAANHLVLLLETIVPLSRVLDFAADCSIGSSLGSPTSNTDHFFSAVSSGWKFLAKHGLHAAGDLAPVFAKFIKANPDCTELAGHIRRYFNLGLSANGNPGTIGADCQGLPPLGVLLVKLLYYGVDNAGSSIAFAIDDVAKGWGYPADKELQEGVVFCLFKGLELVFSKGTERDVLIVIDSVSNSPLLERLNQAQFEYLKRGFVLAREALSERVAEPSFRSSISGFLRG